jgi:hypothetical protein
MATGELHKIIEFLPKLSKPDLKELQVRVGFLLKHSISSESIYEKVETSSEELLVLDSISNVLRSRGEELNSVAWLKKSSRYAAFKAKLPNVFKFLNKEPLPGIAKLSNVEIRAILEIGVKLVIDHMQFIGAPVTGRNIMNHIHSLPAMLNRMFPGYARSGMLHMLVRRKAS